MSEAIRNTTCREEGRYGHATIVPGIVIRSEPAERDGRCAVCLMPVKYERGPQLVTEGTGEASLVCQNCAFRYDRGIGEVTVPSSADTSTKSIVASPLQIEQAWHCEKNEAGAGVE